MATNTVMKEQLLQGMKEIETISGMLTRLKSDLKAKETLLHKMESALKKSEERLEKKVAEIEEKDKRLSEVEGKLLKRQEELRIQEKELQTNAVLEYLSFQAREMEVQKRMDQAPDPETNVRLKAQVDDLKRRMEDRDRRIADLELKLEVYADRPRELAGPPGAGDDGELRREIERLRVELERKDEELRIAEDSLSKRSSDNGELKEDDRSLLDAFNEREAELKRMDEKIKAKQKEMSQIISGMEIKDNQIRELQDELRIKDQLLKMKDEGDRIVGAADPNQIESVRSKLETDFKSKLELIETNYKAKMDETIKKIDFYKTRNEELEMMGDQLSAEKLRVTLLERELRDRMNEIQFSEERLQRRQELMLKERKQIDEQLKRLGEMKEGKQVTELNEELANREKQLKEIEGKLREKEEYLRKKERDIRGLESNMVDKEIMLESEIETQAGLNRVRTGVRRFDDLCYGGFEPNSNFILYGPAYSGRRTFTNLFIAEGLKKGIPTIYVTTQHTPVEVKEQLRRLIPKVDIYEEKGLIKYIDMYSRTMGIQEEMPNTIYVDKPTDLEALENAISAFQAEFKGKHPYHKIVFFSLSTLLTYIEPLAIFRFFQILNAKNKRANAVSLYVIDTGMHDQAVIQTLKHVMTGFIEFKLEDLKYYLRLEGGGDVMSRAWIEYSFTDKTFDLRGSFSLDHIR